ncbi:MAG: trypsin-like peptidase domain-containing protein [Bacteroidales bacterium]|nr:trypsin-like peptidase domain-containing protein [Bacteroidales bacterium]
MNRIIFSITLILTSISLCVAQKTEYTSNFTSFQQIRNYYENNISLLDPIEGEYDVECSGEYITPYVHQYLDKSHFKIWIVCNNNVFTIYADNVEFRKSRFLKIQPIGETNVYTFNYDSTPTRIYLQDQNHFKASLRLNNSSANTFRGAASTSPSVNIFLIYDCIKVYPTMTMYASVVKHVEGEPKPTLWTGTGFALANNYIVTNYHVVEDAKSIFIQGINGNFNNNYVATVVATDKVNDLAILKVKGVNIANIPYSIKTTTSEVGEDVFVLGYPLISTMGDEIKLTTGVLSSKSGFQGDVSLYQISAPVQPGNSGGPLFDSKGNLIGIVSAKHRDAENVGYAIKASYLRNLMESAISTNILPNTNRISSQNLSGKVKAVKNYVYLIICSTENNTTHN